MCLLKSQFGCVPYILAGFHPNLVIDNGLVHNAAHVYHQRDRSLDINYELDSSKLAKDFWNVESFGVDVPPLCKSCKNYRACSFRSQQVSFEENNEYNEIAIDDDVVPVALETLAKKMRLKNNYIKTI